MSPHDPHLCRQRIIVPPLVRHGHPPPHPCPMRGDPHLSVGTQDTFLAWTRKEGSPKPKPMGGGQAPPPKPGGAEAGEGSGAGPPRRTPWSSASSFLLGLVLVRGRLPWAPTGDGRHPAICCWASWAPHLAGAARSCPPAPQPHRPGCTSASPEGTSGGLGLPSPGGDRPQLSTTCLSRAAAAADRPARAPSGRCWG